MTTQLTRRATLPAMGILAVLVLGGCQSASTTTEPSEQNGSATSPTEVSPGTQTPKAEGASALPDWTIGAPQAGTDSALAWEALMGPDGEYAALASYQAVLDEFGQVEPYATIKAAEARHAEALVRQLNRMGVDTPAENPYLGLIAAPADLQTAAEAWAVGEIANVELYDELIAQATHERLIEVFENLRRASDESHLPAFEAAAQNGGTLDPAEIPPQSK